MVVSCLALPTLGDWPELMRFKRTEMDPAPAFFAQNFAGAHENDLWGKMCLWVPISHNC